MNFLNFLAVSGITSSKGVFRTTAAALSALAAITAYYPEFQAYTDILIQIAGIFGVSGIAKAGMKKL